MTAQAHVCVSQKLRQDFRVLLILCHLRHTQASACFLFFFNSFVSERFSPMSWHPGAYSGTWDSGRLCGSHTQNVCAPFPLSPAHQWCWRQKMAATNRNRDRLWHYSHRSPFHKHHTKYTRDVWSVLGSHYQAPLLELRRQTLFTELESCTIHGYPFELQWALWHRCLLLFPSR